LQNNDVGKNTRLRSGQNGLNELSWNGNQHDALTHPSTYPETKVERSLCLDNMELATYIAKHAYHNFFHHTHDIYYDQDLGLFCLVDHHPSPGRSRLLDNFRGWLAGSGIDEVGFGSYPPTGVEQGHTVTMLLDGHESQLPDIQMVYQRLLEPKTPSKSYHCLRCHGNP